MATDAVPLPMARHEMEEPVLPSPGTPDSHDSEVTEGTGSTGEEEEEEELLYGDRDDAQSFIQPSISRAATRLTSPKTPAAEKVAAMDELVEGFFGPDEALLASAAKLPASAAAPAPLSAPDASKKPRTGPLDVGAPPSPLAFDTSLPTPWHAGPKDLVVAGSSNAKPALAGVFGQSSSRPRRSSSVGQEALRRLSKALPSISIPSGFMSGFPTPSFFSSSSSSPKAGAQSPMRTASPARPAQRSTQQVRPASVVIPVGARTPMIQGQPAVLASLPEASRRSLTLRKSPSDDSLLYHSLSRVSSFGDDARFENIREQVNSRFKAIKDSFPDRPTFKMPPMPNIFPRSPGLDGPAPLGSNLSKTDLKSQVVFRPAASLLDEVLDSLEGDIVVLGGYRGSVLRSAEPPHRQLWVPVKVGLNIRKVNMEVGLNPEDEENMEKTIFPSGMLKHIGPVDISRRLFRKLRDCDNARSGKLRVHDYGYDWRLSPHLLSRKLVEFLEKLPSNKPGTPASRRGALVIAHSLGGLITRHAVNQRPELFSGVIYAGTPQRCVNILGPIRNGDAVLLNEKVLTAQVNFTLRTSFVFLPEDGFCFINKQTKEEYLVDFYDINDWIKYRLSPCLDPPADPSPATFFSSSNNSGASAASASKRSSTFGTFLDLSSSFPLRARSVSESKKPDPILKDRTLAPQMQDSSSADAPPPPSPTQRERNIAYLTRVLADTKRFRAETAHDPGLTAANAYPPLAVIYGKDTPTVYAARVAGRDAIARAEAYDDLGFRSGDGVVLAKEAMVPEGYDLVRDGRVSSDRGHITLLGDLAAVGRALEAVVRGRRKGIGLGAAAVEGRKG